MSELQKSRRTGARWLLLPTLLLLVSALAFADDAPPFISQVKGMGFSDGEVQSLEDIVLASYQAIVAARADVTSDRAVMTRQLLLPNVTVKDLEPVMRHSMEAEIKIRLTEVDRQLKIRRLIGDKRWARLMDLAATLKKQTTTPDGNADDSQTNRIINLLRVLGS